MGTEIKIWQIANNGISPVEETDLASAHVEAELENWIVQCPDILGEDLLIIAKQKSVEGVGRLDLLAINNAGEIVIVELKRGLTPREAVAQALDYASWLNTCSTSELMEIAEDHLKRPLEDAFEDRFSTVMPSIPPQNHRILLVGSGLDASSERIINYLAQRYSVNINAAFFRFAKLNGGQEILARSVLVAESVIQTSSSNKKKPPISELLARAAARQVSQHVDIMRALAKGDRDLSETPSSTYGGSFRYWRKDIDGKPRMILGVNVSGERRDTPAGQLDIWIPANTLAQVLAVSEQEAKTLLRQLPIFDMKSSDCIIRLQSPHEAESVADHIKQWFVKYPGFYKHE
ncbi:MAG TPA: endonuclease NucS domain-containing protein [Candidatus Elarobacter sp.]|nr:endonuclease NucS domain-containing protein [Candidatus Elarobacter sp.]